LERRPPELYLLAAAYLAVLVALTLLPFPGQVVYSDQPLAYLRPLQTIGRALADGFALGDQRDRLLIGNVVAFVPLGFLWPLLRPSRRGWIAVLGVGAGLSLAIELSQLLISLVIGYPYRQADVDDVLLNTTGALLGYGGFSLRRAWQRRRQQG
jgi:glycopeptide antibiotics resistance protein